VSVKAEILARIKAEGELTELFLEEVVIDGFPEELWSQPLTSFQLEEVAINGPLPQEIFQLKLLKYLSLSSVAIETSELYNEDNYLTTIPKELGDLQRLEKLELWENKLQSLPETLKELAHLKHLDLDGNPQLEIGLLQLPPTLELLDIGACGTHQTIPENVIRHSELKTLYINHNGIETLPDNMAESKLTRLVLNYNPIVKFPEVLCKMSMLDTLEMRGCKMNQWPKSLEGLDKLTALDLFDNDVTTIGESIGSLKSLELLDIKKNDLLRIDANIGTLQHLKTIRLEYNRLTSLPKEMGQLKKLKSLNISSNKFQIFPKAIYEMEALENLQAMDNHYGQLLPGISALKNLRNLNLHKGGLLFLPKDFGNLRLVSCSLDYNPIKKLPDLTQMQELQALSISGLKDLEDPEKEMEQLVHLKSLRQLSTQNTEVSKFLPKLKELPDLQRVNIGYRGLAVEEKTSIRSEMHPVVVWIQSYRD
jgi:Leucine-rich repeat (LRR) protein